MEKRNIYRDVLFGVVTGDALGVPVEFIDRDSLRKNPVTGMRSYGTHNQPAGTWSDDSALSFCLAEALTEKFNLQFIADKFVQWQNHNYWTPHGTLFDVGITTREAIIKLTNGVPPKLAGGSFEHENGNGSLMRILPLVFYIKDKPIWERFDTIQQVSSITHAHIRSVISCFYYLEFARQLLLTSEKFKIYETLQKEVTDYLLSTDINPAEIALFDRLLHQDISKLSEDEINSSGYVVHTLEASIWCLLKTETFSDAVLRAVNLGSDTDTTGAVTGGLAGLLYGFENIPTTWVAKLAKREEIEDLANRCAARFKN